MSILCDNPQRPPTPGIGGGVHIWEPHLSKLHLAQTNLNEHWANVAVRAIPKLVPSARSTATRNLRLAIVDWGLDCWCDWKSKEVKFWILGFGVSEELTTTAAHTTATCVCLAAAAELNWIELNWIGRGHHRTCRNLQPDLTSHAHDFRRIRSGITHKRKMHHRKNIIHKFSIGCFWIEK